MKAKGILIPDISEGKLIYYLSEKIQYAKGGELVEADSVVLREPIKSAQTDCIRLAQIIRKMSTEAMRTFFGKIEVPEGTDKKEKEDIAGEEIIPYHKRKELTDEDMDAILKEADDIRTMLLSSETDPDKFLNAGKTILTTRYPSATGRRLCTINDEVETAMSSHIFSELDISDQFMIIGLYAIFFALSSVGQRKTISSRVQN